MILKARRTQRSRKPVLIVLVILIIVLIVGGAGWYIYTRTYGNELMKLQTVDYLFATKNGGTDGKIVFIRTMKDKKIAYVVELPEYPFYGDENIGFDSNDLSLGLQITKQMFSLTTPNDSYFMVLNDQNIDYMINELNISLEEKDLISLLKALSKKKFGIFDFLKIQNLARELKLNGNMNYDSFYRLLSFLSNNAVMFDEVKGITKSPVKIKVGDREYNRIYLSPDDVKRVQEVLR
ncbi:MAG: hypothetical protein PWQ20_174 [Thermotogaceae bacterium]|jgi:hypothetical protein|nr:hypothetical protein [Thermotogaceae bacterium]MDN5337104.1 hypothetical protein [Thermotogaceae bacterium]